MIKVITLSFLKNRGLAIKPFIFVGKKDKCLIEHEKVHIIQQGWFPFIWILKWLFNKYFRWKVEKEAMTVQLNCMKERKEYINFKYFSSFMVNVYKMRQSDVNKFLNKWR